MKYTTPSVEIIKVNAVNMLAASMGINETTVDSYGDIQLGRDVNDGNAWSNW